MPESVAEHDRGLGCVDEELLRVISEEQNILPNEIDLVRIVNAHKLSDLHSKRQINPLFDEDWYLSQNRDVAEAVHAGNFASGFVHFIRFGIFEGRWPNPVMAAACVAPEAVQPYRDEIDVEAYAAANPSVDEFLRHFPVIDALVHYNFFGRRLGLRPPDRPVGVDVADDGGAQLDLLHDSFDPAWYLDQYRDDVSMLGFEDDPFAHYLIEGMRKGLSPSAEFDEHFYRLFYPEIQAAIDRGDIPSGFYHFLLAGRAERRLGRFDLKATLEARIPGVTRPVLLERIRDIEVRMRRRVLHADEAEPRRVWVLLPTINPDITFGGYRAVLELIRRLHESGRRVCVVCTEDGNANRKYFLYRESSEKFRRVFAEIEIREFFDGFDLRFNPRDTVIAYSLWDLYAAADMRAIAPEVRVVLLAQEYEPIFYDNNSARALVEQAYNIDHHALINSRFLRRYFERHRVGVFAHDEPPVEGRDYLVFEHRINLLKRQTAQQMRERPERILVTYARPESHAARNMFEILVLALRRLCAEGAFGPEWHFIGLGALSELEPVELGGGHVLSIHPKMSEEEYTRYVGSMDIGVSLMYAPHPSVVPFEFATTGALVVTNTFENRSAAQLAEVCANIIAGPPTVDGLVASLREAIRRVPFFEEREARIFQPHSSDWTEILDDALISFVDPTD